MKSKSVCFLTLPWPIIVGALAIAAAISVLDWWHGEPEQDEPEQPGRTWETYSFPGRWPDD